MKLTHLSNMRIIISRLQPVSGSSSRLALSTVTAAFGHLQPVATEKVQLVNGVPGKTYRIFVDGDIDIQEGDQLKDEDGKIYTAKSGAVTRWRHGVMDYKEIILIQS